MSVYEFYTLFMVHGQRVCVSVTLTQCGSSTSHRGLGLYPGSVLWLVEGWERGAALRNHYRSERAVSAVFSRSTCVVVQRIGANQRASAAAVSADGDHRIRTPGLTGSICCSEMKLPFLLRPSPPPLYLTQCCRWRKWSTAEVRHLLYVHL